MHERLDIKFMRHAKSDLKELILKVFIELQLFTYRVAFLSPASLHDILVSELLRVNQPTRQKVKPQKDRQTVRDRDLNWIAFLYTRLERERERERGTNQLFPMKTLISKPNASSEGTVGISDKNRL